MDPVGPWSSYNPYNRLAPPTAGGDLHHLAANSSGVPVTGSFLPTPPVGYESVFSPLFSKPGSHYPRKGGEGDFQPQQYFEQSWQQNSPFGILPHEVVPNKSSASSVSDASKPFYQTPTTFQSELERKSSYSTVAKPPSIKNAGEESHSQSPISFDGGRGVVPYPGSAGNKQPPPQQFGGYRHYSSAGAPVPERGDYQRPKSSEFGAGPGPDCNVVVPRRPSPLQAHSQASPIGHAQSPAYPMYNSPLNSISSPQNTNHVNPASPLDVSVPRGNTQASTSVAYPSVITRNLPPSGSGSSDRLNFDRPLQQSPSGASAAASASWESKYPTSTNNNYVGGGGGQAGGNALDAGSRFDPAGSSAGGGDMSSCRGDPMSIVKNLQQNPQQQSEISKQPLDGKEKKKPPEMDYFGGRIPPPAHVSGLNQNGYYDFEHWNQSKMFHHPPLPYFQPFLPSHHPPEFSPPVEMQNMQNNFEPFPSQGQGGSAGSSAGGEQPKVVVPNIEEELNFLSNSPPVDKQPKPPIIVPNRPDKQSAFGVGFMDSYLKFLQGEPQGNNNNHHHLHQRKQQNWKTSTNGNSPFNLNSLRNMPLYASSHPHGGHKSLSSHHGGDPQDDPRYFPLPKERKRNFNSSDDGMSSDDDMFMRKVPTLDKPLMQHQQQMMQQQQQPIVKVKGKVGRKPKEPKPPKPPSERKRGRPPNPNKPKIKVEIQPREIVKRAAKDKVNLKQMEEDDIEETPEYVDSDSDPAWTPLIKIVGDNGSSIRKVKPKQGVYRRRKKDLAASSTNIDGENNGNPAETGPKKRGPKRKSQQQADVNNGGNSQPKVIAPSDEGVFRIGEFVVLITDLAMMPNPPLWKVEGKNLLQKFEPHPDEQNGRYIYRNVPTYTSWATESRKQYVVAPVRRLPSSSSSASVSSAATVASSMVLDPQQQQQMLLQDENKIESMEVLFLRFEMAFVSQEFLDNAIKEHKCYQDNFDVYIQTLISQALDSSFLTEIFQEKDDYFLSNVKKVDEVTSAKKEKLLSVLKWPSVVQTAVATWPCYNIIREISPDSSSTCAACQTPDVGVRVLMYGQPYNSTTLEGCPPDPEICKEKDFMMCGLCANRVQLFNKITHQKYLMYVECAKKVTDKRLHDPQKDTTSILNELLADEPWLRQLFANVRNSWAEVDGLEHNHKLKSALEAVGGPLPPPQQCSSIPPPVQMQQISMQVQQNSMTSIQQPMSVPQPVVQMQQQQQANQFQGGGPFQPSSMPQQIDVQGQVSSIPQPVQQQQQQAPPPSSVSSIQQQDDQHQLQQQQQPVVLQQP